MRAFLENCGLGPTKKCKEEECERKYRKAIKIVERLAMMGCSSQDNLPYFNAADYVAAL